MAAKSLTNEVIKKLLKTAADGDRLRITDPDFKGLTVSVTTTGATFSLRFWDKVQNKQRGPFKIGMFSDTLDVTEARIQARALMVDVDKRIDIIARPTVVLTQARAEGQSFNAVADLYIDWLRTPVQKPHGLCPRRESWDRVGGPETPGTTPRYQGGYLKRARAAFGTKAIAEVTDDDIAMLLNELAEGGMLGLAANLRTTLFGLFRWAGQPGADKANKTKFVRSNPCSNLGQREEMLGRSRALDNAEVTTFWHALDALDVPVPRTVALAFKLMLCTGLRGGEVCSIQREWLGTLEDGTPVVRFPAWATKQRRANHHPLNSLAVEIVRELLSMSPETTGPLFPAGPSGAAFKRHMLTDYLTDRGFNGFKPQDGQVRRPGLRGYLAFEEEWRPHDLRHTVATLLARNGTDDADISKLLDHSVSSSDQPEKKRVAKITRRYINLKDDELAARKRPVVMELDRLLRALINLPVVGQVAPLQIAA